MKLKSAFFTADAVSYKTTYKNGEGVGFICWSPDGSCLKTDLDRMHGKAPPCSSASFLSVQGMLKLKYYYIRLKHIDMTELRCF